MRTNDTSRAAREPDSTDFIEQNSVIFAGSGSEQNDLSGRGKREQNSEASLLTARGTYLMTSQVNYNDPEALAGIKNLASIRANTRDSRRVRRTTPFHVEKVMDITRFAFTPKMSGIPRVVRTLMNSSVAEGWTLAVWHRGALAPVVLDGSGNIAFPSQYWRSPPRLRSILSALIAFQKSPLGLHVLALLDVLGILRVVGRAILSWLNRPTGRTRAKVNIVLANTELLIPEVPSHATSRTIHRIQSAQTGLDVTIFIHDLLPLTHPNFFTKEAVLDHVELMRVAALASRITTSTSLLKIQIEESLRGLHGQCPPVSVAELPVSLTFSDTPRWSREDLYCFVGGFSSRKAVDSILQVWELLEHPRTLEIFGQPNPLRGDEMNLYRWAKRTKNVRLMGSPDDNLLGERLSRAWATIYLSSAEGYGLPILESLSVGTPVICADTDVNRYFAEKYGGIALIPTHGGRVDERHLAEAVSDVSWLQELRDQIHREALPREIEPWAQRVFGRGEKA